MASDSWVLTSVEARGYGGIGGNAQTLKLDRPVVVLVGPNGSGKSTWVSAIEWAFFGELSFGNDFSIDELRGNRAEAHRVYMHEGCSETEVVLRLRRGSSTMVWRRVRRRQKPQATHDEVTCMIDGSPVAADPAEVLGITPDIFSRAIAPRQTSLQALISSEDKDRNAALDQLFGIERLNTLTVGLSRARDELSKRVRELEGRFDAMASRLREEVARRFDRRSDARSKGLEAGIDAGELTLEGARLLIASLSRALSVDLPTALGNISSLQTAHRHLRSAADQLWSRPGPQDRLNRLTRFKTAVGGARDRWQNAIDAFKGTSATLEDLRVGKGSEEVVRNAVDEAERWLNDIEDQLSAASKRAAVLAKARDWLREHEHAAGDELDCPVCERPMVAQELEHLVDAAIEALQAEDGEIARLNTERQKADDTLRETKEKQRQLERATGDASDAEEEASARRKELVDALQTALDMWAAEMVDESEKPIAERCARALKAGQRPRRRGDEGSEDDEAVDAELRETLAAGENVLASTREELAKASKETEALRERVIAIQRLVEFLEAAEQLDALDGDVAGDDLMAARVSLQAIQEWKETLRIVTSVAGDVSVAMAEERVGAVSPKISDWFGRISRHDRLKGARVYVETSRTGGIVKNAYRVRAVDPAGSWEVAPGPMLSGGYQTVLTVAALCALADVDAGGHQLGLLILDEPTQSLDPEMSQQMGNVLGVSAPAPTTVVTTTDKAFADAVVQGAGAGRSKLVPLKRWTAAQGTRFEGEGE